MCNPGRTSRFNGELFRPTANWIVVPGVGRMPPTITSKQKSIYIHFSMTLRTVVLSSFEAYLASEHESPGDPDRENRRARFPYSVMLEVSFAELDFANRWCWRRFGPAHGECLQRQSEYPACSIETLHSHRGLWAQHWFAKTDYNFGFNEWYFKDKSHCQLFLASVPEINWGERYPK